MRSITFDDFVQGANDRLSPRILSHYVRADGTYGGPYPRMHNVDRIAGTLRPRGGECKVNGTACPGTILGIHAVKAFTGDLQYPEATHPEVLIVVCDGGTRGALDEHYSIIGRIVPTATTPKFEELGTITGDGPAQFVDLADTVLIYNGGGQAFLSTIVEVGAGTWTTAAHSLAVSGSAYENISTRWKNDLVSGYVSVQIGSTWHGPYAITNVASTGTSNTLAISDSADVLSAGAAAQVVFYNTTPSPSAEVPSKPKAIEAAAGTTLSGEYQYALTYQYGVYETNPSEWSDALTVAGKNILLANIDASTPGVWDTINIYRCGGTLGDVATWIGSLDDPFAKLGSGKSIAFTAGAITDIQTTITVATGTLASWPAEGVVSLNAGDEWVHYTAIDATKSILQGCTREFAGTKAAQDAGIAVTLCSFVDNVPDSATVSRALSLDHGWIDDTILTACKGDRLHLWFNNDHPDEDNMSSTLGWQYLNTQGAAASIDFSNNETGGIRRIGTDGLPVIQAKPGPDGTIIAFKDRDVFEMSGRAFWSVQVHQIQDLPGTDAPLSVTAGDNSLIWTKGTRVWMWNGSTKMDIGDPIRGTLSAMSAAYKGNAVGFFHDLKFYLFYPVDANGNKQYVEWDLRYGAPYEAGRTGPSPITGDGVTSSCAVVSQLQKPEGIVYAGCGTDVWAILGTGATRYTYGQAGTPAPEMVLELPDVQVTDGTADALLEYLSVLAWAEASAPAASVTVSYRSDSAELAHQAYTLDASTLEEAQSILKHVALQGRGAYLGAKISVLLASMATGAACRAIESINMVFGTPRKRGSK